MSNNIEHEGTVTGIISDDKLSVKIVQQSACTACKAAALCTAAESKEKIVEAYSDDPTIEVGNRVVVYGRLTLGYKALTLAMVIPLFLSLITLLLVYRLTLNEAWSGLAALGILLPYYGCLALIRKQIQRRFTFRVRKL